MDIIKRVQVIGTRKCQGFIGLHNFSGSDWEGKFVGFTKKTCASVYMALDEDDTAKDCFQILDTSVIPTHLTHGELPPKIWNLESAVYAMFIANQDHVTFQS